MAAWPMGSGRSAPARSPWAPLTSLGEVAALLPLGDLTRLLDDWYPPTWADSWDAVGPVCGDPEAPIQRILLAVDPVQAVVNEAISWDADVVVVHHPLLLRGVHSVAATTPKGRIVHSLVRHNIALHVCHTNADSPPRGVSAALAAALGVTHAVPLETHAADPLDKIVVFVPHDDLERVTDALAEAGAGAIGDYERVRFVATGTGSFRPMTGARPVIGRVGDLEQVAESRLEMVAPRERRQAVVSALRAAHPYEEPAYDVLEMAALPGVRGSGRIGRLAEPLALRDFASRVVATLPATGGAVRVAGDPDRRIETVAVCGGAGDFLLDQARASAADVYVTSDLRHHPVSELREYAATDSSTPALMDVPHAAAEWMWLPLLAARLRAEPATATVEVRVSETNTDPWTFSLPMTGPERSLP